MYPQRTEEPSEFGLTIYTPADGTAPGAGQGASVTPAQNAYGSYTTLIAGSALLEDCCELTLVVNNVGISGTARDCVVSIGLDPAGGTSFTAMPGADLLVGPANLYAGGPGVVFKLQLWIRASTSIGLAAAVNSATLTAIRAAARVRCRPSNPNAIYVGSYIDSFGVTISPTTQGTAVTSGTSSDGAFVQLGSALTRPVHMWEFGMGINNAAINSNTIEVDIAVGSSTTVNKIVIPNAPVISLTSEALTKHPALSPGRGAVGDLVFARCQSGNNAANTGITIAAYGIGG
jgi:hypothetical protein